MDIPTSTVLNRHVPKEKFYTKTSVSAKLRQLFTDEIEKITWRGKVAPDTLNITADGYAELQIFEIALKGSELSVAVLKHIDTFIPYPILFILNKPGSTKAVISFKESAIKNENQMKVDTYFDTGWKDALLLELKGRSVDEIYKNYLYQIAPQLRDASQTTAKAAVETNKARDRLQKQIATLNRQLANEPSIAKRQEIARQRHELQEQQGQI